MCLNLYRLLFQRFTILGLLALKIIIYIRDYYSLWYYSNPTRTLSYRFTITDFRDYMHNTHIRKMKTC